MLEELLETRNILSKEEHWCKGKLFKRNYAKFDVSYCLLGALMVADREIERKQQNFIDFIETHEVLSECVALLSLTIQRLTKIKNIQLEEYNDSPDTTHSDILKVLDLSIAELEEELLTS